MSRSVPNSFNAGHSSRCFLPHQLHRLEAGEGKELGLCVFPFTALMSTAELVC